MRVVAILNTAANLDWFLKEVSAMQNRLRCHSFALIGLAAVLLLPRPAWGTSCGEASKLLASSSLATYVACAEVVDKYYRGKDASTVRTFVELEPIEVLKAPLGASAPSTLTASYRGGIVEDGSGELIGTAMPRLAVGDTAIVFLAKKEESPQLEVMVAWSGQDGLVNGRVTRGLLKGLTLEQAITCLQMLVDERSPARLAALSDLVCMGEVASKRIAFADSSGESLTLTKVTVQEVLRGEPSVGEITVVQQGDYTDIVGPLWDRPTLEVGKRYVLFLKRTRSDAYEIVGGFGGSYKVEDGTVWKLECTIARFRAEVQSE